MKPIPDLTAQLLPQAPPPEPPEPELLDLLDQDPALDEQLARIDQPYQPPVGHGDLWEGTETAPAARNDKLTPHYNAEHLLDHDVDTLDGRRALVNETQQRCEGVDCHRPLYKRAVVWQGRRDRSAARAIRPRCGRSKPLTDDIACPSCALAKTRIDAEAVLAAADEIGLPVTRNIISYDPDDPALSRKAHDRFRKQVQRAGGTMLITSPEAHLARKVIYVAGYTDPLAQPVDRNHIAVSVAADLLVTNGGRISKSDPVRLARRDPQASTDKSDNPWIHIPELREQPMAWTVAVAAHEGAQVDDWRHRPHPFDTKRVIELRFPSPEAFDAWLQRATSSAPAEQQQKVPL